MVPVGYASNEYRVATVMRDKDLLESDQFQIWPQTFRHSGKDGLERRSILFGILFDSLVEGSGLGGGLAGHCRRGCEISNRT
jgi:hypothetical protein